MVSGRKVFHSGNWQQQKNLGRHVLVYVKNNKMPVWAWRLGWEKNSWCCEMRYPIFATGPWGREAFFEKGTDIFTPRRKVFGSSCEGYFQAHWYVCYRHSSNICLGVEPSHWSLNLAVSQHQLGEVEVDISSFYLPVSLPPSLLIASCLLSVINCHSIICSFDGIDNRNVYSSLAKK